MKALSSAKSSWINPPSLSEVEVELESEEDKLEEVGVEWWEGLEVMIEFWPEEEEEFLIEEVELELELELDLGPCFAIHAEWCFSRINLVSWTISYRNWLLCIWKERTRNETGPKRKKKGGQ